MDIVEQRLIIVLNNSEKPRVYNMIPRAELLYRVALLMDGYGSGNPYINIPVLYIMKALKEQNIHLLAQEVIELQRDVMQIFDCWYSLPPRMENGIYMSEDVLEHKVRTLMEGNNELTAQEIRYIINFTSVSYVAQEDVDSIYKSVTCRALS